MAYNHRPASSISLPGPVTASTSNLSSASPPILLQSLSPCSTFTTASHEKRNAAWKYEGYKAFSSWMASEDDFFLFRRFGSLNSRTILWMQDRITRIESELKKLDEMVENSKITENRRNDSFRWDETHMAQRHALMIDLSQLLQHYSMRHSVPWNPSSTDGQQISSSMATPRYVLGRAPVTVSSRTSRIGSAATPSLQRKPCSLNTPTT
jgi:hypothetical protein